MDASSEHNIEALLAQEGWARSLARRLVHDESLAEDLVQRAFRAALTRPPAPQVPPQRWLANVMRNLARFDARSLRHRLAAEEGYSRPEAAAEAADHSLRVLEARELLQVAVMQLEEPYRSAITARYIEELPPREVARRLGVSVATIKSRLNRAIERLRERLDRQHGGERALWISALAPLMSPSGITWASGESVVRRTATMPMIALVFLLVAGIGWLMRLIPGTREGVWSESRDQVANSSPRDAEGDPSAAGRRELAALEETGRAAVLPPSQVHELPLMKPIEAAPGEVVLWRSAALSSQGTGPRGLAVSANHELFQVDYDEKVIRCLDQGGRQIGLTATLDYLSGLAFDRGRLFASSPGLGIIALDSSTMREVARIRIADPGGHWLLNAICADSLGYVHLISGGVGRVHVFDHDLNSVGSWKCDVNASRLCSTGSGYLLAAGSPGEATTIDLFAVGEAPTAPTQLPASVEFEYEVVDFCSLGTELYFATELQGIFIYRLAGLPDAPAAWTLDGVIRHGLGFEDSEKCHLTHIAVDGSLGRIYLAYGAPQRVVVAIDLEAARQRPVDCPPPLPLLKVIRR